MKTQVTVMLKRLPTLEDYKSVRLCAGTDREQKEYGDNLVNALMPQFNDNLRVELDDTTYAPSGTFAGNVIHFECDIPDYQGAWCLPADMFTIRGNFDLKD